MKRTTLRQAIAENRLSDFIEQAEADGIGAADPKLFNELVKGVTTPRPSDQTSHSPAPDGSREK
jgi:hypothetical protein